MALNFCSDCHGEMNPILMKINHKGYCQSYRPPNLLFRVPNLEFVNTEWCARCGSGSRDDHGEIIHQPFCKAAWEKMALKNKGEEFKTTFTELKVMSVDGLIVRASKIASEAHREMARKYTRDPYIHHPMKVAGRVMLLAGVTPVEIAAAWLHDVLRPTDDGGDPTMSAQDLTDRGVPPLVVNMVLALTPPSWAMPKEQRLALKSDERVKLNHQWFVQQDDWVKKIKLLDRIDNLMDLSWKDKDYMALYCAESRGLVEQIGSVDDALKKEALTIIDYYENELMGMMMAERDWS